MTDKWNGNGPKMSRNNRPWDSYLIRVKRDITLRGAHHRIPLCIRAGDLFEMAEYQEFSIELGHPAPNDVFWISREEVDVIRGRCPKHPSLPVGEYWNLQHNWNTEE